MFRLSLHDYRHYGQHKGQQFTSSSPFTYRLITLYLASYTENDFSWLRSKIQGLPASHKASLEALLQHLSLVSSHADGNGMGPQDLASAFALHVFGRGEVLQGSVDVRKMARVRFIFIPSSIHLFL